MTQAIQLKENYWRWRAETMQEIIADHDSTQPLFLDGRARNQGDFFNLFGAVVLLRVTAGHMRERLNSASRSHDFGQHPVTQDFLVESLPDFESHSMELGALPIGTDTLPINLVTDRVLELCIKTQEHAPLGKVSD